MNQSLRSRRCIALCLFLVLLAVGLGLLPASAAAQGSADHPTDRPEPRVAVLMYHHLSVHASTNGTITPTLFHEHLETLRRLNLPVISLAQLASFLEGKTELPPESVVLTFDDGYESFYRSVFPELKAFNVPAAVFVIVRPTAHPETASPVLPHLTWAQLKEMVESGLVTAGSHTYDQHRFVALPSGKTAPALVSREYLPAPNRGETVDEYENRVLTDLAEANRQFAENLGSSPEFFAYPYGRYDSWLIQLCRAAGYRFSFTTRPGVVTRATDPFQIPRYGVGNLDITPARLEELLRNAFRPAEPPPAVGTH